MLTQFLIESLSQNVFMLLKNLQANYKPLSIMHHGLVTNNTRALTIKTNKRLRYRDQKITNAVFFIPSNTLLSQPAFQAQTNPMTVGSVPYTINWSDPQSAMGLFGLDVGTSANLDLSALLQLLGQEGLNTSQETGAIDIRRVHNVYIHSNSLSNNNVIGTDGGRTTLVKIPVLGQVGDVLHRYHSGHAYDFVDVSNKTLSTLDFEIKDGRGDLLDLRGGTVSIELLFANRPI